jgi:hypothetical protein
VAICPGFKVTGVAIPVAPKREPATEIEEIVTGAVPDEVRVTDCVAVLPTETFPNVTDGALRVRAGVPAGGATVMVNVCAVPPSWAVIVAVWGVVTPLTVALNPVLDAPDRIVTEPGTVTAELLLVKVTPRFRLVLAVRYTEQGSVAGALYELPLQETRLSEGDAEATIDAASKAKTIRLFRWLLREASEIRFQ